MTLLDIANLSIEIGSAAGIVNPVRGVSLQIKRGDVLGLVGESGCGKTITSMALAGLLPPNATLKAERLLVADTDMRAATPEAWRALRRDSVGVVFQNPMKALNPRLLIGSQLTEAMLPRDRSSWQASYLKAVELLEAVGVDRPAARLRQYPHELSGGLAQRVVIALALARGPKLLIADEPTTALDVSVQKQILNLLDKLRAELGLAVLLVTHDLDVIRDRADRVAVMYAGRIVEVGTADEIIDASSHPYTAALVAAMPSIGRSSDVPLYGLDGLPPPLVNLPPGCALRPRCPISSEICGRIDPPLVFLPTTRHWAACHNNEGQKVAAARPAEPELLPTISTRPDPAATPIMEIRSVSKLFDARGFLSFAAAKAPPAVNNVSLAIGNGESLGIVGESGSGKTTIARMMVGLEQPTQGEVLYGGQSVAGLSAAASNQWRRDVQFVFQDSSSSLDPRFTIARSIEESLLALGMERPARLAAVHELLAEVGLTEAMAQRKPHQLSGGQRQRVGIARALARNPRLIIADEPVSALDVSVQATILNLLNKLRRERGMSYIIISHDLGVIKYICKRVAVVLKGQIVEQGPVDEVLANPTHPYTRKLVDAAPGVLEQA